MKVPRYIKCLILLLPLVLAACEDEVKYNIEEGDGMSTPRVEVAFRLLEPALDSRAAGNAIDEVNSLWVVIYRVSPDDADAAPEYVDKIHASALQGYKIEQTGNGTEPGDVDPGSGQQGEGGELVPTGQRTAHATFTLPRMPYGWYRMYAVANVDLTNVDCSTVDKLRSLRFDWNSNVSTDNQMFGYFTAALDMLPEGSPESQGFDAPVIVVNNPELDIHSWIRRLASKVTVAYDATSLKEGISIKLESVRIRRIPKFCYLGQTNTITSDNDLTEGEVIAYASTPVISKENPFYPAKTGGTPENPEWTAAENPHSNSAEALYFYENNQGVNWELDRRNFKDWQPNGNLDEWEKYPFEKMPYATFIEVDATWESVNPDDAGSGPIKYRFMLGKDLAANYEADRNYHFKLTLHFNGNANDYDWRIDLEKFLIVPQPKVVDYQGRFLVPDDDKNNLGNTFSMDNDVIVRSYEYNIYTKETTPLPLGEITYSNSLTGTFTSERPDWLQAPVIEPTSNPNEFKVKFRYNTLTPESYTIGQKIGACDTVTNLAGKGALDMTNTANCYIVGATGEYTLPLVYGNARTNGADYTDAYNNCSYGNRPLATLKNYKGAGISSPYILDDIYGTTHPTNLTAELVWEDVKGLISSISYQPTAYGSKGGIKFTIGTKPDCGGNAVIAIKASDGIMWSWHIWVTNPEFATMRTQTLEQAAESSEIMPVNLGWCSSPGDLIRYYAPHECYAKITNGINTRIVKIVQREHLAIPQGNYTYFQWGRKDPFPGATNTVVETSDHLWVNQSKTWYSPSKPSGSTELPTMLNSDISDAAHTTRPYTTTRIDQGTLIKNPFTWNNPRCSKSNNQWVSNDQIYSNLWTSAVKTVYDPCPVGFQVTPSFTGSVFTSAFGGFVNGSATASNDWFNVLPNYMLSGFNGIYQKQIVEFYTSWDKVVSTTFIEAGYRDYDHYGDVFTYAAGHIWYAQNNNDNNSFYFYYYIENPNYSTGTFGTGSVVAPAWYAFYPCDGFGVRPTKPAVAK